MEGRTNEGSGDIVVGTYDFAGRFFTPSTAGVNAIKVVARRSSSSLNGRLALFFGQAFSVDGIDVQQWAIAVAVASETGPGIYLLRGNGVAFEHSGDGDITIDGPVYVNSVDGVALSESGNGTLQASSFEIVGGLYQSGNGEVIGPVHTGVDAVPDPLADLPVPDPLDYPVQATEKTDLGGGSYVLSPGRYQGGITLSGDGTVYMEPGVYLIEGGGFKVSSNGVVQAEAVVIYNTDGPSADADQVLISGDATVTWSAPESGDYAGIIVFQDRAVDKKVQISGNGDITAAGTIYAMSAEVQLSGNGTNEVAAGGVVASSLQVSGNCTFGAGAGSGGQTGSTVFLVE